jgi:hypothetical protein
MWVGLAEKVAVGATDGDAWTGGAVMRGGGTVGILDAIGGTLCTGCVTFCGGGAMFCGGCVGL